MGEPLRRATGRDSKRPTKKIDDLARQMFEQQSAAARSWCDAADSEKVQWRARAERSLRALADLGYRVDQPVDPVIARAEAARAAARAQTAEHEAEKLLHMGEPLLAYNAIQQALAERPGDTRLRQLKG